MGLEELLNYTGTTGDILVIAIIACIVAVTLAWI